MNRIEYVLQVIHGGDFAMKFTFSDMNSASGEILEAAPVEPVSLTKRGKTRLVILTAICRAARRRLEKSQFVRPTVSSFAP